MDRFPHRVTMGSSSHIACCALNKMKICLFLYTLFLLCVITIVRGHDTNNSEAIVTVKQGRLLGALKSLLDGSTYYSFKGIPYAQPPIGNLRFRAPLPPLPWNGTYNATEHGPVCPQMSFETEELIPGSEDCLFLNVYTKSLNPAAKTPVMVFIHGGSFSAGSGNADTGFGPEFLLQHDVIIVTINYRLEVLGFLSLDTPDIPGNAGMKDQVLALRWVKDNIAQFGGNPDDVTLFGESAGAVSVIYHMYSPMSTGLFHKAIAQSGVTWHSYARQKGGRERAFRLGKVLGKNTNDENVLLDYFKSLPAIQFANKTVSTMTDEENNRGLPIHFSPVFERIFEGGERFLSHHPRLINKVPLMLGYNSEEALIMMEVQLKKLKFFNENLESIVPEFIAKKHPLDRQKEYGKRIRNYYIGDKEFTVEDKQNIATLFSDLYFVYDIHSFANFYSRLVPIFRYKFSLETDLNVVKKYSVVADLKGASHADELFYIFFNSFNEKPYKEQEKLRQIVFNVTKLWTNFAKTGNPTPDPSLGVIWKRYSERGDYLDIADPLRSDRYPDRARIQFWNELRRDAVREIQRKRHNHH